LVVQPNLVHGLDDGLAGPPPLLAGRALAVPVPTLAGEQQAQRVGLDPAPHDGQRFGHERDLAQLGPLAAHADDRAIQVDLAPRHAGQLVPPAAGQQEQRAEVVVVPPRPRDVRRQGDRLAQLVGAEHAVRREVGQESRGLGGRQVAQLRGGLRDAPLADLPDLVALLPGGVDGGAQQAQLVRDGGRAVAFARAGQLERLDVVGTQAAQGAAGLQLEAARHAGLPEELLGDGRASVRVALLAIRPERRDEVVDGFAQGALPDDLLGVLRGFQRGEGGALRLLLVGLLGRLADALAGPQGVGHVEVPEGALAPPVDLDHGWCLLGGPVRRDLAGSGGVQGGFVEFDLFVGQQVDHDWSAVRLEVQGPEGFRVGRVVDGEEDTRRVLALEQEGRVDPHAAFDGELRGKEVREFFRAGAGERHDVCHSLGFGPFAHAGRDHLVEGRDGLLRVRRKKQRVSVRGVEFEHLLSEFSEIDAQRFGEFHIPLRGDRAAAVLDGGNVGGPTQAHGIGQFDLRHAFRFSLELHRGGSAMHQRVCLCLLIQTAWFGRGALSAPDGATSRLPSGLRRTSHQGPDHASKALRCRRVRGLQATTSVTLAAPDTPGLAEILDGITSRASWVVLRAVMGKARARPQGGAGRAGRAPAGAALRGADGCSECLGMSCGVEVVGRHLAVSHPADRFQGEPPSRAARWCHTAHQVASQDGPAGCPRGRLDEEREAEHEARRRDGEGPGAQERQEGAPSRRRREPAGPRRDPPGGRGGGGSWSGFLRAMRDAGAVGDAAGGAGALAAQPARVAVVVVDGRGAIRRDMQEQEVTRDAEQEPARLQGPRVAGQGRPRPAAPHQARADAARLVLDATGRQRGQEMVPIARPHDLGPVQAVGRVGSADCLDGARVGLAGEQRDRSRAAPDLASGVLGGQLAAGPKGHGSGLLDADPGEAQGIAREPGLALRLAPCAGEDEGRAGGTQRAWRCVEGNAEFAEHVGRFLGRCPGASRGEGSIRPSRGPPRDPFPRGRVAQVGLRSGCQGAARDDGRVLRLRAYPADQLAHRVGVDFLAPGPEDALADGLRDGEGDVRQEHVRCVRDHAPAIRGLRLDGEAALPGVRGAARLGRLVEGKEEAPELGLNVRRKVVLPGPLEIEMLGAQAGLLRRQVRCCATPTLLRGKRAGARAGRLHDGGEVGHGSGLPLRGVARLEHPAGRAARVFEIVRVVGGRLASARVVDAELPAGTARDGASVGAHAGARIREGEAGLAECLRGWWRGHRWVPLGCPRATRVEGTGPSRRPARGRAARGSAAGRGDGGPRACLCLVMLGPGDGRSFALAGAVRGEADNDLAVAPLAQLAGGAGDVIAVGRRAGRDLAALRCRGIHPLAFRRVQHHDNRRDAETREGVSFRQGVRGEVHCEARRVGRLDGFAIGGARHRLVRIGETTLARVGGHELAQLAPVNGVAMAGQVARLVMAPELAIGKRCDLRGEGLEVIPGGAFRDLAPMNGERPALRVAAARLQWAGIRAGGEGSRADWDRADLAVARFEGEVGLHGGSLEAPACEAGWLAPRHPPGWSKRVTRRGPMFDTVRSVLHWTQTRN
ncbi:hypothetical protein K469DRAFT_687389, partial [Zopfia rhizophila CBS 207.26]